LAPLNQGRHVRRYRDVEHHGQFLADLGTPGDALRDSLDEIGVGLGGDLGDLLALDVAIRGVSTWCDSGMGSRETATEKMIYHAASHFSDF